jgi:hypothetical protein
MFGLMKPRSCGGEKSLHRRLSYCGTCKTMGSLYGQKSRFLLNHDTVFLSELLTVISGKADDPNYWSKPYHSYNCFSLPKNKEEMPIELQVSATATVVLTGYKLADHITDTKRSIWLLGQKLFSKSFNEASKKLKSWNFPLEEMDSYLLSQSQREKDSFSLKNHKSSQEILDYLAEPTAKATALFFEQGARLVNKAEHEKVMYQIGIYFGTIAYLIDAYEDYKKDLTKGEFNALKVAFGSGETLSFQEKSTTSQIIWQLAEDIHNLLPKLEINPSWIKYFNERLRANLSLKLTGKLPILNKTCSTERVTFSIRKNVALNTANTLTTNYLNGKNTFALTKLFSPLIFLFVYPIAFLLPKKTSSAKTYKECINLSLNLISLKVIWKALLALPKTLFWAMSPEEIKNYKEKNKKKRKKPCKCCEHCDCCDCCDCIDCAKGCKSCGSCFGESKIDCCPCDGDCGCCGCDCCDCTP